MSLEVNVTKRFDGFTLHAAFTAGDTATALLGASGCGKSMTLFQNYALFPNMTVEQNILSALKKEKDPAARRAACAEALRAMRLEELAKRLPGALSGGQQQRAALARILAAKPRILMLDEPFSALDSYLREEVEGEVGSLLAGFAGTALLVTHNRDEAYRLCREMIVMDSGEVLRAGTTKDVFADPRTRAAARLTGCKNILPCTRVGEHTVYLAGWEQPLTVALPVPEGCRAVGIRAHDFAPCAPGASIACADLRLSFACNLCVVLSFFSVIKTGTQNFKRFFLIFMLASFVLTFNNCSRRNMGNTNGR